MWGGGGGGVRGGGVSAGGGLHKEYISPWGSQAVHFSIYHIKMYSFFS